MSAPIHPSPLGAHRPAHRPAPPCPRCGGPRGRVPCGRARCGPCDRAQKQGEWLRSHPPKPPLAERPAPSCPRCGGPRRRFPSGRASCRPCDRERQRRYRARFGGKPGRENRIRKDYPQGLPRPLAEVAAVRMPGDLKRLVVLRLKQQSLAAVAAEFGVSESAAWQRETAALAWLAGAEAAMAAKGDA